MPIQVIKNKLKKRSLKFQTTTEILETYEFSYKFLVRYVAKVFEYKLITTYAANKIPSEYMVILNFAYQISEGIHIPEDELIRVHDYTLDIGANISFVAWAAISTIIHKHEASEFCIYAVHYAHHDGDMRKTSKELKKLLLNQIDTDLSKVAKTMLGLPE